MRQKLRQTRLLETAFGPDLMTVLEDISVTELMANPDGSVWREQNGQRERLEAVLTPASAERIIRTVAGMSGQLCTPTDPIVSAELPFHGERFEGLLPPLVSAPCFVIRKPSSVRFTLDAFCEQGMLTEPEGQLLKLALASCRNIVIAGGTASGKTTFANALIAEIGAETHRLVLIEDTVELDCAAEDHVQLRTLPGHVSMRDLVKSSLRLRPDRIIIGEVRGGEALDLLKAWNTGHPGGITTLHANSAGAALTRLEQLVGEAASSVSRELIAEAIDLIVHLAREGRVRKVTEILSVNGIDQYGDFDTGPASLPPPTLITTEETAS